MNTISRATIFGAVFLLAGLGWILWLYARSAYSTQVGVVREQPVEFSHEHHVAGLGIDCRYCHTSVETSPFAGIPPTATCMQCHSQIWANSPKLEPVRASFRTGESIPWTRVHDLPDYAYFDHSIHVQKGVACVSCHGRVDQMPLTWRVHSLHMQWCLDCHRDPAPFIRPRNEVFSMTWTPPREDASAYQAELVKHHQVDSLTNCSVCHH